MYVDQGQDLKAEYKKYKEQGSGDLPNSFKIFENKLKSTNTGFVVGTGLTYADLELFDMIDKAAPHHSIIFQNYPLIEKHFNLVKNIPNIAKWLSARPVTSM